MTFFASNRVPILTLLIILASFVVSGNADHVLYNSEVLMAGQNLTNGPYMLSMQPKCDLTLYNNSRPIWRANINGNAENCYLGLKQTGELVVRRDIHYTLWSSNARSKKGRYVLVLDGYGSLSVYGSRRWISNNNKEAGSPDWSPVATEYVLGPGERLFLGQKLVYGNYELSLLRCNLVINSTGTGKILWQTNTKSDVCYLKMEKNGELVLKRIDHQKLWSSNRGSDAGMYIAVLRYDGRLAVYGPMIWSTSKTDSSHDRPYQALDQA